MTRITYLSVLTAIIVTGLSIVASCGTATQESPQPPGTEETEASPGLPINPSEETSSPMPATFELEIANFAFTPATTTVPVGATVTWYNNDSTAHTVTARDPLFDSGRLSSGKTFRYVFNEKGTFKYFCAIHPYMTAVVIVD